LSHPVYMVSVQSADEQHVRRTLTLTHTITAYSVSGNAARVGILKCATRQKPCRKRVHHQCMPLAAAAALHVRSGQVGPVPSTVSGSARR